MTAIAPNARTIRQHLREHPDHAYEHIVRGVDPERLHRMDHAALRRRGIEHQHKVATR